MSTNGTVPTHEEQIEGLKLANEELGRALIKTAIMAETMLRVMSSLARRTGVPQANLVKAVKNMEIGVIADMKSGAFDPTRFSAPFVEDPQPSLILPPLDGE